MRIAVFGGTFDPIHLGHLRVAEETFEGLGQDRVVFMPAFVAPHKEGRGAAEPEKRLEMARLAVEGNPNFEVSDAEIKRQSRSYTIDTVRELKEKGGKDLSLSLIVGTDSFNDITTWCEYERLFEMAGFIVVQRPGFPVKKPGEALPVELARKFWYDAEREAYMCSYGTSIVYFSATHMAISSSDIRERVRDGSSIRYLVPEKVIEYIARHGLYKQPGP